MENKVAVVYTMYKSCCTSTTSWIRVKVESPLHCEFIFTRLKVRVRKQGQIHEFEIGGLNGSWVVEAS